MKIQMPVTTSQCFGRGTGQLIAKVAKPSASSALRFWKNQQLLAHNRIAQVEPLKAILLPLFTVVEDKAQWLTSASDLKKPALGWIFVCASTRTAFGKIINERFPQQRSHEVFLARRRSVTAKFHVRRHGLRVLH